MLQVGFLLAISILVIAFEVYAGAAVIGLAGERSVVLRKQSPGPFWFSIILQTLIFVVLPTIFLFAK